MKLAKVTAMQLPGLGYRGFRYEDGGETRRAFGGLVEHGGILFEDGECEIERALLATMPEELAEIRQKVTELSSNN